MAWTATLPDGRDLWECNRCGKPFFTSQEARPEGYHIRVQRVYNKKNSKDTDEGAFYCTKDCMMNGIQYHNYS